MEIETGILLIERRDPGQAAILRTWLNNCVFEAFTDRILAVDIAIAQCCAKLHVPDPRSDRDTIIAVTAFVHGMTVVTRNVDDFTSTGIEILNPWKLKQSGN